MAGHSGHSFLRIYVHRQLPGEQEIKSPNGFHALPSNLTLVDATTSGEPKRSPIIVNAGRLLHHVFAR